MKLLIDCTGLESDDFSCEARDVLVKLSQWLISGTGRVDVHVLLHGNGENQANFSMLQLLKAFLPSDLIWTWESPAHIKSAQSVALELKKAVISKINPDIVFIASMPQSIDTFNDFIECYEGIVISGMINLSSDILTDDVLGKLLSTELLVHEPFIRGEVAKSNLKKLEYQGAFVHLVQSQTESGFDAFLHALTQKHRLKKSEKSLSGKDISGLIDMFLPQLSEKDKVPFAQAVARNFPQSTKPQLLIDISALNFEDAKTGIQRVVRSILFALLKVPPTNYVVRPIYGCRKLGTYRYASKYLAANDISQDDLLDRPIDYKRGDVFIGLDLHHLVVERFKPLFRKMSMYGVRVHFVIYDLLPILFPQFFELDATAHASWLKAISEFDAPICISQSVAQEYSTWIASQGLTYTPKAPVWFHLGADIENSKPSQGLPPEASHTFEAIESKVSFLMVGTIEPRKGYAEVLDAFEQLWAKGQDINLVMVGKEGWFVDALIKKLKSHKEKGKRLFWFSRVSDEYLALLYQKCHCLIAASYGEGFGLPLIEASQKRLPIIARDIPVFKEVAGEYAHFFKSEGSDSLSSAIDAWLVLFEQGRHPQSSNMPHLTWQESAKQLIDSIS